MSTVAIETKPVPRFRAGDWLVHCLVPVWVLLGAGMKLFTGSPLDLPQVVFNIPFWLARIGVRMPGGDVNAAWQLYMLVISAEIVIALIIMLHPRWGRPLAIVVLAGFVALILSEMRVGSDSCGCFGTVSVPPWLMLVMDGLLLVGALVLPRRRPRPPMTNRRWVLLTLLAALGIAGTWAAFKTNFVGRFGDPAQLIELDLLRARGRDWSEVKLFQELPINPTNFPEPAQQWIVYRETCGACHALFQLKFSKPTGQRVIAVLVPAFPPITKEQLAAMGHGDIECPECIRTSLPGGKNYKINTPLIVYIQGRTIVDVSRYKPD